MAENLYNSAHKASSKEYLEGWERIWGKTSSSTTVKVNNECDEYDNFFVNSTTTTGIQYSMNNIKENLNVGKS